MGFIQASSAAPNIKPGDVWLDDRGRPINAHGAGVIKIGEAWYMVGEYRPKDAVPGRRYVSCYSSTDLISWKFLGLPIDSTAPDGIGPQWILERPKLFYNAKTKKYVMWMHIDGPLNPNETDPKKCRALKRLGVAISDTVAGPYKFVRTFNTFNTRTGDVGQFIDDDGTAYLILTDRDTKTCFIAKLSDDYLDLSEKTSVVPFNLEGGALVHYEGLYYLVASLLSGWNPNANKFATAKDLKGPWSEIQDIAPPEKKTYKSQSTMLVKVVGTQKTSVIFMADQWKPSTQWDSRYLWMPLEIGNGKVWLPEPRKWTIDVKNGVTSFPP